MMILYSPLIDQKRLKPTPELWSYEQFVKRTKNHTQNSRTPGDTSMKYGAITLNKIKNIYCPIEMRQIAPFTITHLHAGLPYDKNIYRTSVHMAAHYKTKTSTPFIMITQLGRLLRLLGGRMPSRARLPSQPSTAQTNHDTHKTENLCLIRHHCFPPCICK